MKRLAIQLFVFAGLLLTVVSCKNDDVIALRDIVFEDYPSRINVGEEIQFVVKFWPEDANHNLPQGELHWSNSNPEVCTLSDNGLLTTICSGRTTITAEWGGYEAIANIEIQDEVEVNDKLFQSFLLSRFDKNGDGIIQGLEICDVNELDLTELQFDEATVISIKGIEKFSQLKKLKISFLTVTDLDLSQNKNLEQLICHHSGQEILDLSANTKLWQLDCHSSHSLSKVIFPSDPDNNALNILICDSCAMTSLDLSACVNLEHMSCRATPFDVLDVSNCSILKTIKCDDDLAIIEPIDKDLQFQVNGDDNTLDQYIDD